MKLNDTKVPTLFVRHKHFTSDFLYVLIFFIIIGIWWLVDWIRILADSFPDGNGIPLRNDM